MNRPSDNAGESATGEEREWASLAARARASWAAAEGDAELLARCKARLYRMEKPDIGPEPGCTWREHYLEDVTALAERLRAAHASEQK